MAGNLLIRFPVGENRKTRNYDHLTILGKNKMMKQSILFAAIGALTLSAQGGDWGKAPVGKEPIEECVDLGGEIGVGYMSDYIFYGARFAGDSVWTSVSYTIDGLAVPVTVGAWYLNGINEDAMFGGYDELDLFVSAEVGTFAGFDVSFGYTHFLFPELRSGGVAGALGIPATTGNGYGEIGLDISRSLGFVDLAYESNYAMGGFANGWYHQIGIEKSFGLTDSISLVLGAGVGYSDNYFGVADNSDWNHYYVSASLPIALNCRTTLTPYLGLNGSPEGTVSNDLGQSDILHGGVSLTVSF
ncbi:MAG: hypothetical protein KDN18_16515 [Verrucomicrobiae bacterium]|nr:hypothetical protein [Verrucomicrobiae bacterium]